MPFRIAVLALALLQATVLPAFAAGARGPWIVEALDVGYRFENDGTYTHTVRARMHVTTEEGRRTLGEFFFPYHERSSRFELRYLRTVKASGETIVAEADQLFDVAPPAGQRSPVFSDLRYKALPVPGLEVGDRIEYETVNTVHTPLVPGQFWGHHRLTRHVVVGRETVRLDLPARRELAFEANQAIEHAVEERNGRRVHTWTHANPEPDGGGGWGTPLFNLSTFRTWPELGSWMHGLIAERAAGDEALAAFARERVGATSDPREQVEILYTWVAQSVRYVRVALGIGSFEPHAAATVRRNLYGDCKDKHALLAALLAAVGIEASAALVHSTRPVDPRLPTPEAFDHLITVVQLGDDRLWLDTTEELAPPGWLAPGLRGGRALVAREHGSQLEEVPRVVPVPDARRALLRGSIDADGGLHAELRLEHRGSFEVGWRTLFHQNRRSELETALRLDRPPALRHATAGAVTTSDPLDTSGPFVVEYALEQPAWLDPRARAAGLALPSMILGAFAGTAAPGADPAGDPTGLALGDPTARPGGPPLGEGGLAGPFRLEERIVLATPPGLVVELPADVSERRDFASYTATYAVRDGVLEATRTLEIEDTDLTPARREDVVAFVRALQADIGRTFPVRYADPE